MVNNIFETKAGTWKVKGLLRVEGVHAGAIEFRFQKPSSGEWLAGSTTVPKPLESAVEKAKDKVRSTLKARFKAAGLNGRGNPKPVAKKPAAKK